MPDCVGNAPTRRSGREVSERARLFKEGMIPPDSFNVVDVAYILGVDPSSVLRYIRAGDLFATNVGREYLVARRVTSPPLEKACTKCDTIYPRTREYWPPYKKNADNLSSWCKKCHAEETRKTNLKHRTAVLAHYSAGTPRCACCGETRVEFLSIDHINGGGRAHRLRLRAQGLNLERYLVRSGFPEGFRVLCHNCNQAMGYLGYCPHQERPAGGKNPATCP